MTDNQRIDLGDDADLQDEIDGDPVGATLAHLCEIVTEAGLTGAAQGVLDPTWAEVVRATLRECALGLGYQFMGEIDPAKARPRKPRGPYAARGPCHVLRTVPDAD